MLRAIRIFATVLLAVFSFGLLFWLLFYSVHIANREKIIALRVHYANFVWRTKSLIQRPARQFPPFDPVYNIFVLRKKNYSDTYVYSFVGRFERLDFEQNRMNLRGFDGKLYSFLVDIVDVGEGKSRLDFISFLYGPPRVEKHVFDKETYFDNPMFFHGSIFSIAWSDTRTLREIVGSLKRYGNDSTVNGWGSNYILYRRNG